MGETDEEFAERHNAVELTQGQTRTEKTVAELAALLERSERGRIQNQRRKITIKVCAAPLGYDTQPRVNVIREFAGGALGIKISVRIARHEIHVLVKNRDFKLRHHPSDWLGACQTGGRRRERRGARRHGYGKNIGRRRSYRRGFAARCRRGGRAVRGCRRRNSGAVRIARLLLSYRRQRYEQTHHKDYPPLTHLLPP